MRKKINSTEIKNHKVTIQTWPEFETWNGWDDKCIIDKGHQFVKAIIELRYKDCGNKNGESTDDLRIDDLNGKFRRLKFTIYTNKGFDEAWNRVLEEKLDES